MGGFLQQGGQSMGGGAPTQVGNAGGVNWGGVGGQINTNNNTDFSQFLGSNTAGMQPSIAQAQLKAATDQGVANTMAMAAGGRGANSGTTQHLAMQNGSMAGQQSAQQSGILAAQQQQQNAQNALQYKGMMDQYNIGLMGASNQRDLGTANIGVDNSKIQEQGTQNFGNFLGNMGSAAVGLGSMLL